ncbi:MAG TPA: CHASE3 domain-containing protein [Ohtaekwangia sp.]|nr:CHASE3 domain-containing protein [Ohtaekwangia sp.]
MKSSSLRIIYSLIVFILGIVLLSVLTVLFIYENWQTKYTFDKVNQTNIVRYSLEETFSILKDAESAYRGYLLTNDSSYLKHYPVAVSLDQQFKYLDSLVIKDRVQTENVKRLKVLFDERMALLNGLLEKAKDPAYKNSKSFYNDLQAGVRKMERTRQLLDQMQEKQLKLLQLRQEYADRHSVLPTIIGIAVSIFSILIFIVAFYFTNIELRKSVHLNKELESKNLQLEKYAWELSSFTHITSHDMQEPLRKIELFISMIDEREKDQLSPNALKYFGKIKESVIRMRQLFLSILNFSLTDQLRNNAEDVDLNSVLDETLDALKVYIKDTNASINCDTLPVVEGVRYQLVQLFENILSNALKYKRVDVVPEINIRCEIVDGTLVELRDLKKDKKYHVIHFEDNGIGFDPVYGDKIFEIFQRLHTRKQHSQGVGIGLSICRKIAQNHNGTITAKGEIDNGASFSLYLPVAD